MPTPPRLFLDANIFIAAAASEEGGSSLLIEFCSQGKVYALTTRLVLREAERNVRSKLNEDALVRFYNLLAQLSPITIPLSGQDKIDEAASIVHPKDAHVLAAARSGNADYLVTLDRKHFLSDNVRQAILPMIVCTPGEFFMKYLSD